jgi:phi13 family phage major tail protein
MSRKVKIGLKEAYYAILTKDDKSGVLYNVPERFENIRQVVVTPRVLSVDIAADDDVENITEVDGADVTIEKKYLTADEEAILLGKSKIGDMLVGGDTDNPPYMAFGYKRTLANGSGLYVWILKMKMSESASTADTKAPDSINPQYDSLTGRSQRRTIDRTWIFKQESDEADFGDTWFTKAKLETLGNVATTEYGKPAEVEFVAELPGTGTPGTIYVDTSDDTAYYYDGTNFVEISSAEE